MGCHGHGVSDSSTQGFLNVLKQEINNPVQKSVKIVHSCCDVAPLDLMCLCPSRDAADLVVQGKGKFEELMVCSHEIAASTAQLVAASKVGILRSFTQNKVLTNPHR